MNEAELLFTTLLNCDRLSLYLDKKSVLDKDISSRVACALKRRILGEPIYYILGKIEFMGLEFKVDKFVFIPRQETELLAETAIKYFRHLKCKAAGNILDLCTGSGCIAVALAKLLPEARINAVDISQEALKIAEENARLNNVTVNFLRGDLFNNETLKQHSYDLIVTNPPYIRASEIKDLEREVRHEPRIALDGGRDGLTFYRNIIKSVPVYLKEGGFLITEIGSGHEGPIRKMLQKSKSFEIIETIRDYNNIERIIVAKKTLKRYG